MKYVAKKVHKHELYILEPGWCVLYFQVASSTLDASAKIYAGRVDAIHTETYKVLSGLGRTDSKSSEQGGKDELFLCVLK